MNCPKIKSNKSIMCLLVLVALSSEVYAHNKNVETVGSVNYQILIPIICVVAFAFFMFHAFMKQKR